MKGVTEMKKGINLWCFPAEWPFEEKIKVAKQAGFQGIELNVEQEGYLTLEATHQHLRDIKSLVEQYHMEITSISSNLFWQFSLTSNDRDVRQKAIDVIKTMADFASFVSVSTILVVPGLVTEEVSYDVAYDRSKQAIQEAADYVRTKDVTIAIENVWNKFLLSPLEMKKFIEEINHSHVGVYFDVGNILNIGFPEQWIQILGDKIKRIHVKDFKAEVGNYNGFTTLLQGDVNWISVMTALKKVNYDGFITAEIMPPKYFAESFIHETSKNMDVIIKGGF
jgi:L-ribulose-5-phosphate 3-epimerase